MSWAKPQNHKKTKVTPKGAAKLIVVSANTGEIKHNVELLKASADKAFEGRGRFWFYPPLEQLYAVYFQWKQKRHSKKNAKHAAALFGVKPDDAAHPLRILIDIVMPPATDNKSKARWKAGLHWAWQQGVEPKDLGGFFKTNGGIAGCARQFHAQG